MINRCDIRRLEEARLTAIAAIDGMLLQRVQIQRALNHRRLLQQAQMRRTQLLRMFAMQSPINIGHNHIILNQLVAIPT